MIYLFYCWYSYYIDCENVEKIDYSPISMWMILYLHDFAIVDLVLISLYYLAVTS